MTGVPATQVSTSVSLNWKAKLFVAICAVFSTAGTAFINNAMNARFAHQQEVSSDRKAAVEKVQAAIHDFNSLTAAYMTTVESGQPSKAKRDALLESLMNQRDVLGGLLAALPPAGQTLVRRYQGQLVEIAANLRKSSDLLSTVPFGQSVSEAVDERVAVVNAFRANAQMPAIQDGDI